MADVKFLRGLLSELPAAIVDGQLLITTDQGHVYLDTSNGRVELYKDDLDALQLAIDVLNGSETTDGSVAKAIADLKTVIEGTSSDTAGSATIAGAKAYADAAVQTLNDSLAAVATSGKASDVTVEDAAGSLDATTVEDALAELVAKINSTSSNAAVTISSNTNDNTVAKTYVFTQNGSEIGTISIPKDMVVESGSVVTLEDGNTEGLDAGTYIKLVIANATNDTLYVNVSSLIEYVTSGSQSGDMVVITIDSDHKVTATITDGTVTKAKLDSSVQASLDLADTAVQPDDLTDALDSALTWGSFTDANS